MALSPEERQDVMRFARKMDHDEAQDLLEYIARWTKDMGLPATQVVTNYNSVTVFAVVDMRLEERIRELISEYHDLETESVQDEELLDI